MRKIISTILTCIISINFVTNQTIMAEDTSDRFEIIKTHFNVLDEYVQDPNLFNEETATYPNRIAIIIIEELTSQTDEIVSSMTSMDKNDENEKLVKKMENLVYTASQVTDLYTDMSDMVDKLGNEMESWERAEFRDRIVELKFIYSDVFGENGWSKDYIYQELRTDYSFK